jgi:hypothetical protein
MLALALCAACSGGDGEPKIGYVALLSESHVEGGSTIRRGSALARFDVNEGCTESVIDEACTLFECLPHEPKNVSAGPITVTGAAVPITLTPQPKPDNRYTGMSSSQPLYVGDETLAISSRGAEVPAFALTLTAPSQPTITVPSPAESSTRILVTSAAPFHVEWTTPTIAGEVYIQVADQVRSVRCGYASNDKRADIPVSTLAVISTFASYRMSGGTEGMTEAGDWNIVATAEFEAVWPDNSKPVGELRIVP